MFPNNKQDPSIENIALSEAEIFATNNNALKYSPYFKAGHWGQSLELLKHLCQYSDSIVLVLGDSGIGKTTLKKAFLEEGTELLKYCDLQAKDYNNIDNLINDITIGFEVANNDVFQNSELATKISQIMHNKICVLLIDDAHLLSIENLQYVLKLFATINSLNTNELHNFKLVLLGENSLEKNVENFKLQLNIVNNSHILELEPLTELETELYLNHKWRLLNDQKTFPFKNSLIKKIYKLSHGNPREIELLANKQLDPKQDNSTEKIKSFNQAFKICSKFINLSLKAILIVGVLSVIGFFLLKPFFLTSNKNEIQTITLKTPTSANNSIANNINVTNNNNNVNINNDQKNSTLQTTTELSKLSENTQSAQLQQLENKNTTQSQNDETIITTDISNKTEEKTKEIAITEQQKNQQLSQSNALEKTITENSINVNNSSDLSNKSIPNANASLPNTPSAITNSPQTTNTENTTDQTVISGSIINNSNNTSTDRNLSTVKVGNEEVLVKVLKLEQLAKQDFKQAKSTSHQNTSKKEQSINNKDLPNTSKNNPYKSNKDLKPQSNKQNKLIITKNSANKKTTTTKSILSKDEQKILAFPSSHYTVQLVGTSKISGITAFIKQHKLQNNIYYFRTNNSNAPEWYILIYGNYSTKKEAQLAITKLSPQIRALKPWPRDLASIKRILQFRK